MRSSADRNRCRRRLPALVHLGPTVCVAAALLAACGGAFDPAGPQARDIAVVWWLMFALGTAVYIFVLVVLIAALRRGRRSQRDSAGDEARREDEPVAGDDDDTKRRRRAPRWVGMPLLIGGGVVAPALVVVLLTGATAVVGPQDAGDDPLRIEVEARRYWWRVAYPDEAVVTANEVVIPTGVPVELSLTSDDVIHSFWVPRLAGKIDMVPGRTNELVIEADEPGRYEGACAEYCGLAHAQMRFLVIARESDEFDEWLANQAEPPPAPEDELALQGREAFLGSACVYCHRVDGTNATSDYGPDLSHIASRQTLGAGILPNTRGHLAGWILDPQAIKPGTAMPNTRLDPEQVEALLAYMETLE